MSFEPRDYVRHILVEADYLVQQSERLTFEAFVVDETPHGRHARPAHPRLFRGGRRDRVAGGTDPRSCPAEADPGHPRFLSASAPRLHASDLSPLPPPPHRGEAVRRIGCRPNHPPHISHELCQQKRAVPPRGIRAGPCRSCRTFRYWAGCSGRRGGGRRRRSCSVLEAHGRNATAAAGRWGWGGRSFTSCCAAMGSGGQRRERGNPRVCAHSVRGVFAANTWGEGGERHKS